MKQHSLSQARLQLCGPEPQPDVIALESLPPDPWNPKQTDTPLWMLLDLVWRQEILRAELETGLEIFKALRIHGMRHKLFQDEFRKGLMADRFELYVEDDPKSEEGYATEHRVRSFAPGLLLHTSRIVSTTIKHPANPVTAFWRSHRFLGDRIEPLFAQPAG